MTEFWNRCEGQVANSYRLERYLGGTVYSTGFGADSRPAVIKLMQVETADWQRQLATWAAISKLSHPNLIALFDSGHCEIEGVPLLYVVMERSEGNLAGVLPERPLTENEASEMLASTLEALAFLHEDSFVHAGVRPSNIMAIGEEIKLASDCIARAGDIVAQHKSDTCPAPESWDGVVTPATDVWSLGATLVQALTQRPPDLAPGDTSEAIVPRSLPQPFFDIAWHCLRRDPRSRCTVGEIASRLRGPQRVATSRAPRQKSPRPWVALYSIVGAILVLTAVLLLLRRDRSQPGVAAAPPVAAISVPAPPTVAAPIQQAPALTPKKSDAWFVVVATYAQKEDAERRALELARRWPRFQFEAYAPPLQSQKAYYLVVIGSNLSQEAAAALKEQARAAGLAPDAYITRFSW